MSRTSTLRDSGRQRIATVDADVDDYADAVSRGAAIQAELAYGGWLYARHRPGNEADIVLSGSGGGFYYRERWSIVRLRNFLRKAVTPACEARRGPPREVWPYE